MVSVSDVTERKGMALEAQKSRQELAHFLRVSTIGELTTSLAHELNQPLAAILANAQAASRLLRDSAAKGSGEIREILGDVADEARRAGDVIQRLRVFLRKGEPNLTLIEVNAMVREVIDLLRSDALIRGVQVQVDLDPRRPTVRGDRVQLEQVLLNLLLNSLEAMADEGANDRVVEVHTASDQGKLRPGFGGRLRAWPPHSRVRRRVRALPHHQGQRPGHGVVDRKIHRGSPWRHRPGPEQPGARRHLHGRPSGRRPRAVPPPRAHAGDGAP